MQFKDATTLQGIREDIYFIAKCNSSFIADNDLNRIVNKYYGQLQEAVRAVNENFYMVVATTDLVIGDGSYTMPDGTGTAPAYEKLKSIWACFDPADITAPLQNEYARAIVADADAISNPAYVFSTPTALIFGDYFVLFPLVTDVTKYPVTDGVKVYYIATQDKLVNDTDVPKIFPSFHDAITQGSLIDVAERLGNDKLKSDSVSLFKKRLEEIKAYASDRIPDESSIIEGQDAQGGWAYNWGNNSMS